MDVYQEKSFGVIGDWLAWQIDREGVKIGSVGVWDVRQVERVSGGVILASSGHLGMLWNQVCSPFVLGSNSLSLGVLLR